MGPIHVIAMDGYPKHGLWDRIDELFDEHEEFEIQYNPAYGRHQYFYNSAGWQFMYFTNVSIPDNTNPLDIWGKIWDYEDDCRYDDNHEHILTEPYEFYVDGWRYVFIGWLHGYHHDSRSPNDPRYEG